ncbi:hypothetical protein CUTER_00990 [Corynebacterium uterequi]|uniref:Uncharacterized protein n=1 Tax=Corynebacterium uterequi TaxID=1072256 RepID=A0A0G3HA78_9CORY|nr:hypothetical protein CUTER_00990 [Corynebacterium uterequi]
MLPAVTEHGDEASSWGVLRQAHPLVDAAQQLMGAPPPRRAQTHRGIYAVNALGLWPVRFGQ